MNAIATLGRRQLLGGAAALGAGALAGSMPHRARAQGAPIRIAVMTDLNGPCR